MSYQVLLFYKYVTIEDPESLAASVRELLATYELKGRFLIAEEGINAILEGETQKTEDFFAQFIQDPRFTDLETKRSAGDGEAFKKTQVKVREEIVGTHFDKSIDPRVKTAPRIRPEELREWYEEQKDFVVIDMRNDYEFQSGHFKDSVNPGLENSRDLPKALPQLEQYKDKKVLTVCTGGVRCEKMSAFLLANGFKDVQQLDNGIHAYMEKYPAKDFLGTLYTFDGRKTMDFGGEREIIGRCKLCGNATESYVNCADPLCHLHFLACEDCQSPDGTFCGEERIPAHVLD